MKNLEKQSKRIKKPWPTKDAMTQVYKMKLWGDNQSDFYSGEGSHHPTLVKPYLNVVIPFLTSFKDPITVCDLGCGDFNVGKKLVPYVKKYIAVDIVADLITRNKKKFRDEKIEFCCLDIAKETLPPADGIILRQVLQHLSNDEVNSIVSKLSKYTFAIVTEHIPDGDFEPNKDIISGQGIRLKKQSGLNLLTPPFNLKVKEERQLIAVVPTNHIGVLVTTLYIF
ncbi:methyltransferase domain-containing protein [Aquimarina sp. W85]|uniref:methyltransferase domain-containing protein n=1 Tax=Aquimarina rhodophyticola TaxID=3342246 RepID=UPI003670A2F5